LDRLAAKGVVFEQAITQAPNTWVSHAGILTGLYPPLHGLRTPHDRIGPEVPTLASVLAENGYPCAGFPGNDLVGSRMGFGTGFDLFFEQYFGTDDGGGRPGETNANIRNRWEDILDAAEGWLVRQGDRVFLWFHYLDTHHLPECDLPEYYRYSQDPSWQFYEGKISYADQGCIGAVMKLLLRSGRYEDTLLLVLSDHGEELIRGAAPVHNGRLTEAVLRVPLILFSEHNPWKGLRIPSLVRTSDIVPTLLDGLLDLPRTKGERTGNAFSGSPLPLPGLDRRGGLEAVKELAYAENEPLGLSCVRSEQWKYVAGPTEETLFDVSLDPQEQGNVIDRHPNTAVYLKRELEEIRSLRLERERTPAEREEEETRRLLRAFGYLE
jgi:arylsulfatase A-like enzyme